LNFHFSSHKLPWTRPGRTAGPTKVGINVWLLANVAT
jgi:hypothetical protein